MKTKKVEIYEGDEVIKVAYFKEDDDAFEWSEYQLKGMKHKLGSCISTFEIKEAKE